jgi:hypothetical protein
VRAPCSIEGCERVSSARSFCTTHYARWKKGAPLLVDHLAPPAERFWRFVNAGPNGCWVWGGAPNAGGYGALRVDRKTVLAHRFSYKMHHGEVPLDLQVDHLCANRRCVNPDHLEAVTCAVNVQRAKARITHCPHGHAYDEMNTYINHRGARICRTCTRAYNERKRVERMQVVI